MTSGRKGECCSRKGGRGRSLTLPFLSSLSDHIEDLPESKKAEVAQAKVQARLDIVPITLVEDIPELHGLLFMRRADLDKL